MDEKMFELMSKMYAEMQEGFALLDNKIENGIKEVKLDLTSLESKMDDNHKALYDGYVQNADSMSFSKKVD